MTRHNILIIANRRSGTGSAADLETLTANIFQRANAEYKLAYTREPGHATDLAREGIRDGYNAVVAAGGDGTVNEVARALIGSEIPLGIIPRGSGNGLARHLGIPLDAERALECVLKAPSMPIDTFTPGLASGAASGLNDPVLHTGNGGADANNLWNIVDNNGIKHRD